MQTTPIVVIFDGQCGLCRALIAQCRSRMQSAITVERDRLPWFRRAGDTMGVIRRGRIYTRSTAALMMGSSLRGFGLFAVMGLLVPAWFRDAAYRWVAKNRHRWFGCPIDFSAARPKP